MSAPVNKLKKRHPGTVNKFFKLTPGFPNILKILAPLSYPGAGLYPASEKARAVSPEADKAPWLMAPLKSLPNFFSDPSFWEPSLDRGPDGDTVLSFTGTSYSPLIVPSSLKTNICLALILLPIV